MYTTAIEWRKLGIAFKVILPSKQGLFFSTSMVRNSKLCTCCVRHLHVHIYVREREIDLMNNELKLIENEFLEGKIFVFWLGSFLRSQVEVATRPYIILYDFDFMYQNVKIYTYCMYYVVCFKWYYFFTSNIFSLSTIDTVDSVLSMTRKSHQ